MLIQWLLLEFILSSQPKSESVSNKVRKQPQSALSCFIHSSLASIFFLSPCYSQESLHIIWHNSFVFSPLICSIDWQLFQCPLLCLPLLFSFGFPLLLFLFPSYSALFTPHPFLSEMTTFSTWKGQITSITLQMTYVIRERKAYLYNGEIWWSSL